jgi:hypothetical protein
VGPIVKAAAVQIGPVLYSRQGTVEKVVKKPNAEHASGDACSAIAQNMEAGI